MEECWSEEVVDWVLSCQTGCSFGVETERHFDVTVTIVTIVLLIVWVNWESPTIPQIANIKRSMTCHDELIFDRIMVTPHAETYPHPCTELSRSWLARRDPLGLGATS